MSISFLKHEKLAKNCDLKGKCCEEDKTHGKRLVMKSNLFSSQCDQIWLFLKDLENNFFPKVAQIIGEFTGLFRKTSTFKKKIVVVIFWSTFEESWAIFIPKSGHAVSSEENIL